MLDSDKILAGMHQLHPKLIDLSLDRLVKLLDKLGNPQDKLPPIIHIAGTNGKGSTLAMLRSILQSHNKRVHAYSSPHLVRFHERISLAHEGGKSADISEPYLVEILNEVNRVNAGEAITFFEMTTAVGLLAFSRIEADFLILEVGLGGRFDATNVMSHVALSIITPVSIDHTQFLGNKLTDIAFEKAGIIKKDCPVIVAAQSAEAFDVIEKVAQDIDAPMTAYGVEFQSYQERDRLIYQNLSGLYDLPLPRLQGAHQIQNASVAIAAAEFLLAEQLNEQMLAEGIKQASWPARFEQIASTALNLLAPKHAEIWLDGGHNAAGGIALAQHLSKIQAANPRPLFMIIGMMNSKEAGAFLKPFAKLEPMAFCMPIEGEENSFSAKALQQMATKVGIKSVTSDDFISAFAEISALAKTPIRVLICGSLYQAGNVLSYIEAHKKTADAYIDG